MATHYVLALVHHENDVFGISFPDYPGAVSGGSSFEEAVSKGGNALAFHLRGMDEDGDDIAMPTPIAAAIERSRMDILEGALPVAVEVDFPGKAVRINISVEEGLLGQIDRAARESGLSRSAFLAESAKARLNH